MITFPSQGRGNWNSFHIIIQLSEHFTCYISSDLASVPAVLAAVTPVKYEFDQQT